MNKAALHLALTMFGLMALPPVTANERPDRSRSKEPGIQLTSEHMEAVNRQRRIIFQDNVMCSNTPFTMERVGPSSSGDASGLWSVTNGTPRVILRNSSN